MSPANSRPVNLVDELPSIANVQASRARYDPPRAIFIGRELVQVRDAIELLVRTTAALPVRDVSPVLFIGETAVADYETAGQNLYRFFVFTNPERLVQGAPIAIGWPYAPRSARLSNFRFQILGNPPVA
jgi:hypothetical protein